MTRLLRTAVALGVLAAAAAGPAVAGPGGPCGGGRFRHFRDGISELGLPADTNQAAVAALERARDDQRAIFPDVRAAHERMQQLLAADNPSLDAVNAEADTIGALKARMGRARLQALVTIRSLLTADQWRQLQDSMHRGRHGGDDEPVS